MRSLHLLSLLSCLLLLFAPPPACMAADCDVLEITTTRGEYTISLLYTVGGPVDEVLFVHFDDSTSHVWLIATEPSAVTQDIGCRAQSVRKVVIGPTGCSAPTNPDDALVTSNCFRDLADRTARLEVFLDTWWLTWGSPECIVQANNDARLCLGPLLLSIDNEVDEGLFPGQNRPTSEQLIRSRAQYIYSGIGPYCAAPTVARVYMELPHIRVTITNGTCDGPGGGTFAGLYNNYGQDTYQEMITTVWITWQLAAPITARLALVRPDEYSPDFRIAFISATGVGTAEDYFEYWFQSEIIQNPVGALYSLDWVQALDLTNETEYRMTATGSGVAPGCDIVLSLEDADSPMTLRPIPIPTSSNYAQNVLPSEYGRDRICDAHFGYLNFVNKERSDYCPVGDVCGGDVKYVHPEYHFLPVFVPKDESFWRPLSCKTIYPRADTFLDYGKDGVTDRLTISAVNPSQEACFYPFLVNELVTAGIYIDEAWRQCQMFGGQVFTSTATYCAIAITEVDVRCAKGWLYFQDKCIKKFSPYTDGRFSVPIEEQDRACFELSSDPPAQPIIEADQYMLAWLRDWFLYIDPDLTTATGLANPVYRIRDTASQCICYNQTALSVSECGCDDTAFPVCWYDPTTDNAEPYLAFTSMTLRTATILRDGQVGLKHGGFEAICECKDGYTGRACQVITCPVENSISSNPEDLSQLVEFFRRCRARGGACLNGQARTCQCEPFYGPPASILESQTVLYKYRNVPCGCYAGLTTSEAFEINGVFYNSSDSKPYVPCSGSLQGACIVSNATNLGVCEGRVRPVPNPSIPVSEEVGFDGKATSCVVPIQPFGSDTKNGPIVSALCNSRGTCCPLGQRGGNPLVGDVFDSQCYDSEDNPVSGCNCDNGWGGVSCTCPMAFDYARDRFIQLNLENSIYVDMGGIYFIGELNITGRTPQNMDCAPFAVQLSNELNRPSEPNTVDCAYNANTTFWDCPTDFPYQFIVLRATGVGQSDPVGQGLLKENCLIMAYEFFFPVCGKVGRTNPFAGRAYDNVYYRGPTLEDNILDQFINTSTNGCTNGPCFCSPDYTGRYCAARVTSLRPTSFGLEARTQTGQRALLETTFAKQVCNELVTNPDETDPVRGAGQVNDDTSECECNPISNLDPTGGTGLVQEIFSGSGCQCADVFVKGRQALLQCAGRGICMEPRMPYGRCSVDWDKYLEDALSEPYADASSQSGALATYATRTDSYVIYTPPTSVPTGSPTGNPTVAPTGSPAAPMSVPTSSPTMSPTTSPTPAPSVSPTTSPTSALTDVMVLFSDDVPYDGKINGGGTTGISGSCIGAAPVPCVPAFSLPIISVDLGGPVLTPQNLAALGGFDPLVPVFNSDQSIKIADSWTDMLAGNLLVSLNNAGVHSQATQWTGSASDGSAVSDRCASGVADWDENTADNGGVGSGSATSTDWLYYSGAPLETCPTVGPALVCGCIVPALATSAPTTASPTFSPSQAPTPYDFPNNPHKVAYRILAGTQMEMVRTRTDIAYCPWSTEGRMSSPPANMTITTEGTIEPIWWANMTYREYDIVTNMTDTKTMARCNPAEFAQPPGFVEIDGPCPFYDPCLSREACSDELAPPVSITEPSYYAPWPDLRGCVCSYDIEVRTDVPSLDAGTYDTQIMCMHASVAGGEKNEGVVYSNIRCQNFLERAYNCAMERSYPWWVEQCTDEPIGCYDFSVGRIFGGFDNAHPTVSFLGPPETWEVDKQWKMIASIMNNATYTRNTIPFDPFSAQLMNDYVDGWVAGADEKFDQVVADGSSFISPWASPDYLQARADQIASGGSSPQWTYLSDRVTGLPGGELITYTWDNMLDPRIRMPGVGELINTYTGNYFNPGDPIYLSSVDVTFDFDGYEKIAGVEVYNQFGGLCAKMLRPPTLNETVTFSCLDSYDGFEYPPFLTSDLVQDGGGWVKFLGVQEVWDVPLATAVTDTGPISDPIHDVCIVSNYTLLDDIGAPEPVNIIFSQFRLSLNTALQSFWFDGLYEAEFPEYGGNKWWPTRRSTAWSSAQIQAADWITQGSIVANVTAGIVNTTFDGVWDDITTGVLLNNTYPYNQALADHVAALGDVETHPFTEEDLALPHIQAELLKVWQNWLSARFAGAEDSQCEMMDLGQVVYPASPDNIRWRMANPDSDYDFLGDEGGCQCPTYFSRGFSDDQFACKSCIPGYGPVTTEELDDMLQSSRTVAPLVDLTEDPWATYINGFPTTTAKEDYFETNIACRYPFTVDPVVGPLVDINVCAGHGMISEYQPNVWEPATFRVFEDTMGRVITPTCTGIWVDGVLYELQDEFASIDALIYGTSDGFTVVNGALWASGGTVLCGLDAGGCTQVFPAPPLCAYTCADGSSPEVLCDNPSFFGEENHDLVNPANGDHTWLRVGLTLWETIMEGIPEGTGVVPTPAPTFSPTVSPTSSPTVSPTVSPTMSPTSSPTVSPTASPTPPTNAPTDSPTLSPTVSPTPPTNAPTDSPTVSPTPPTNAPTVSPTRSPTASPTPPTNAPTDSPSTSPTVSPTASPIALSGFLLMYDSGLIQEGDLGDREATTAICELEAANIGLVHCSATPALLSYDASDNIDNFPDIYNFKRSNDDVYSTGGIQIGDSWTKMMLPGGTRLENSLYTAGVLPGPTDEYWTGAALDGSADPDRCRTTGVAGDAWDTTNGAYSGTTGLANNRFDAWIRAYVRTCDTPKHLVCVCMPQPIPELLLYSDKLIAYDGNLGDRATTTAMCAAEAGVQGLTCGATPALLSYSASDELSDFPSLYGFDGTNTRVCSTLPTIISESWDLAFSGAAGDLLLKNLRDAGVVSGAYPGGSYWTGSTTTGDYDSGAACINGGLAWTTNSNLVTGSRGLHTSRQASWIDWQSPGCHNVISFVCVCTPPPTAAPTAFPTPPTDAPTASPTPPTNAPTASPTTSPIVLSGSLIIYDSGEGEINGNIGDRAATTATCAAQATTLGFTHCGATPALLTYSGGDSFDDFPGDYGFDPTSTPIYSVLGIELAPSWDDTLSGATRLTNSFWDAGVFAGEFNKYWTGASGAGGANSNRCRTGGGSGDSWESANDGYSGMVGRSDKVDSGWINAFTQTCELEMFMACVCTPAPTAAPTAAPTVSPTVTPEVILFQNPSGNSNGILGDIVSTAAECASRIHPGDLDLECSATPAFLCYDVTNQISDFPTLYGFDASLTVTGPTGTVIASSWTVLTDGSSGLTNSFNTAGASSTYPWNGCTEYGEDYGNTCSGWTSTSGSTSVSNYGSTAANWMDEYPRACSITTYSSVCVCVP